MKLRVLTEHPVAVDSLDHQKPCGTARDNSRNPEFNKLLFRLFSTSPVIRVLDLGAAGGGFVKDILDAGHVAIGIEGSDYSLKNQRAEWATIPDNLFTADIAKPFSIVDNDEGWDSPYLRFDVVTAWEVLEHIPEDGLPQLCENVLHHLAGDGLWLMSISPNVDPYHATVQKRDWWLNKFDELGFVNDEKVVAHFGHEWVRGPKQGAPGSFHLALRRK